MSVGAAPAKEFKAEVQPAGSTLALGVPVTGVVSARLVVAGPDGFRVEKTFTGSEPIAVNLSQVKNAKGEAMAFADGEYKWELRVQTPVEGVEVAAPVEPSTDGLAASSRMDSWLSFGRFTVHGGGIVPIAEEEKRRGPAPGAPVVTPSGSAHAASAGGTVTPQTYYADSLYVAGGVCAGCSNGDSDLSGGELLVKDTVPWLSMRDTDNDQLWRMLSISGPFYLRSERLNGSANVTPFTIEPDTPSNTLYLAANGTVGIGTSTPSTAGGFSGLDIVRANGATVRLTTTDSPNSYDWTSWGYVAGVVDESTGHYPFLVYKGAPSYALTVLPSGRVAIGTASAVALLDVNGSGGGNIARVGGGALMVERTDGQAANIRFSATSGTTKSWLFINNPANYSFGVRDESAGNSPLIIYGGGVGGTLQMKGGRVGILTGSPQGALDVNGAIYQRGGVLHADYVFEPSYRLESIEDHAEYMWTKKHLPGVPGVRTDEKGREVIELGSNQRGMLEELEKAHIYIEELDERLAVKDRQMAEKDQQIAQLQERLARVEQALDRIGQPSK
jgi:hypothetical protein